MMKPEKAIQQAQLMLKWAKSVKEGNPIKIEHRSGVNQPWLQSNPDWQPDLEYREKPKEPLQAWLICRGDEIYRTFESKDKAFRVLEEYDEEFFRVVHMKEVE